MEYMIIVLGIPLAFCLGLFVSWLDRREDKKRIKLLKKLLEFAEERNNE